jgi:predicted ATPase
LEATLEPSARINRRPAIAEPGTLLLWRAEGDRAAGGAWQPEPAIVAWGGALVRLPDGRRAASFASAADAAAAALELRRAASRDMRPALALALHSGVCGQVGDTIFGAVASRAGALLQSARGQILISHATAELLRAAPPAGARISPLGSHRLLDLLAPEPIHELRSAADARSSSLLTLDHFQHNLPLLPTPFVGRARDVAAVCASLRASGTRLLTLVATSGTGKTRFSLEVAARLLPDFAGGVYFVALAAVTDPQLVVTQIAHALGLREEAGRPLIDQLIAHLRDRAMLLVLDNFEQVLAASGVVADLLAGTARLQIIATSHVPLRVPGEQVLYVPPMDLPNPERPAELQELIHYDAVALFVERAQAVAPWFTLTEQSGPVVAAITARLGGLPLAIDLVASYVDQADPRQLLAELGDYKRSSMPLPQVLDWAHARLAEPAQHVFARLGVFAGGCTFDVAEQICRIDSEHIDVRSGLALLVRRNLIFPEQLLAGVVRYVMLDCVHDLARAHLVHNEEVEVLAKRHTAFYAALAAEGYAGLHGEQQSGWLRRIESEQHNMRQAFRWALNTQHYEIAGQFVIALGRYWHLRGAFSEGQHWVDALLPHCAQLMPASQAQLFNVAAVLYGERGYHDRAAEAVQRALELHRTLGNAEGEYHALSNLGVLREIQGELDQAERCYQACLRLADTLGNARLRALALNNLGDVMAQLEDYPVAAEYLAEALGLAERAGDEARIVDLLGSLGWVTLAGGDRIAAGKLFAGALARCRDMQGYTALPELFEGAAGAVRPLAAARLLGAVEALREASGRPLPDMYRARVGTITAAARSATDAAGFAAAWADGRAMSWQQALAHALQELDSECR